MLGLLVQNQSHRAGTHLRGKLLRRIAHQTFFSGEMVSANPGAVQTWARPCSIICLRSASVQSSGRSNERHFFQATAKKSSKTSSSTPAALLAMLRPASRHLLRKAVLTYTAATPI